MKLSTTLRDVLLTGTGVALALVLAELPALFNLVDYRNVTWLSPDRFDPQLLTMHRPYARFRGSSLGGHATTLYKIPRSEMSNYQWDEKCDAHGFRNDADLGRADVVVVGGSFVEGMTVPNASLMTSLLAHQTGTAVANLGQQNFAPQQDLIALKRYGLPLQPRTVIWMFTDFNDLRQVLYYRFTAEETPGPKTAFLRRSFSYFAYKKLLPDLTPKIDGATRSGLIPDAQGAMTRIYFIHALQPLSADSLSALDETRATFAKAYELSAAQGARLLVVFVPEPFRVFQPFARFPADSVCSRWTLNDEPQRIEAAVHSISPNIGYLDLTPALRQAVSQGSIPYYKDDNHWSPAGHQIAARAIGDYLSDAMPDSTGSGRF